jgi:acyl carrier protein
MIEADVREKLRSYIARELIRDAAYPLSDGEGIISGGLMDSFALAELAVFVESEFGVYVPDPDLTVDKMDTLDQIVARVMRGAENGEQGTGTGNPGMGSGDRGSSSRW